MKNRSIAILYAVIFTTLFLNLKCKDEPTKPPDNSLKGPRTYTWTVDTITYPGSWQTNMQSIWGSSTSDVYIVGHNDQMGSGNMFHFNGKSWSATKFHSADGGTIYGAISLTDVYGFASNDIWAIGSKYEYGYATDSSFIMHYNGSQWSEQQIKRGGYLQTVWGIAPNDVWAGGLFGTLYHYNGTQWSKVSVPLEAHFTEIEGSSFNDIFGITYHLSQGVYDTTVWSMLHWDGTSWTVQMQFNEDNSMLDKFGTHAIHYVNGICFSAGRGYFTKVGSNWERIYYAESHPVFWDFAAKNENDVIIVGLRGLVYHYNGNDWYQFQSLFYPNVDYGGCWRTDKEVFVVGTDGNKTVVLHGS
jgi:hypothetical protein